MKQKNRAWVKNAVIIFLSIMLILTFFSNTIMNYSLPEVSGQNLRYGEISTAIRGTGTVEANEAFNVELEQSREIRRVHVRVGDEVEAGQLLFELEEKDSTELDDAIKTLEKMRYEYNKSLLSASSNNYKADDLTISRLQEALQEAMDKKETIDEFQAILKAAESADKAANNKVQDIEDEIAEIEERITNISTEIDPDLLDEETQKLADALKEAKDKLKEEEKLLEKAKKKLAEGSGSSDVESAQSAVIAQEAVVRAAETTLATVTAKAVAEAHANPGTAPTEYTAFAAAETARDGTDAMELAYESALHTLLVAVNGDINHPEAANYFDAISSLSSARDTLQMRYNDLNNAKGNSGNTSYLQQAVTTAENRVELAQEAVDEAQEKYDEAVKDIEVAGKKEKLELQEDLKEVNTRLRLAKEEAEETKKLVDEAKEDATLTTEEADKNIKAAQQSLEDKMLELDLKKETDKNTQALASLDFEKARKDIAAQEEVVANLRDKEQGTEVTAKYAGVVLSISATAGDKVEANTALASIEVNGRGYTLSFSVSMEESRRVKVGDTCVIGSWWGEDTICTLVAIKTDPNSQGRKRILEFNVEGNASAGQSLDVTLGERSQNYEHVVPNSAIREDSNGTFVLVATDKQTPLGTRYTAERYDVTVVAEDSRNTAITGAFNGWEYIITTTTKPIEAGTQVRLVG